jgi:SAM-dependent methyltransferase
VNKMNNELFRISSSMRKDWDDRARKDAYYYIASWKKDWDEQSFLRSGEDDYLRLVQPALDRNNFLTADKSMLELGCGAGRMTGSLAQRFARVIAFDVSPAMLERARLLHRDVPGITWVLGNGTDLSPVPSASVDFVFSYLVLRSCVYCRDIAGSKEGWIVFASIQRIERSQHELERPHRLGHCRSTLDRSAAYHQSMCSSASRFGSADGRQELARRASAIRGDR